MRPASGIWAIVEPWYERAESEGRLVDRGRHFDPTGPSPTRVVAIVAWASKLVPGQNEDTLWQAYGDLYSFADEAADRRGLEGDLDSDPGLGSDEYAKYFSPMHLRIEKQGDQPATAEIMLAKSGEKRILDHLSELPRPDQGWGTSVCMLEYEGDAGDWDTFISIDLRDHEPSWDEYFYEWALSIHF